MPTAVISGASRGAWRSGRYATRSIVALTTANSGIVIASVTTIPPTTARLLELAVEAEHREDHRARDEPREREHVAVGEVDQLQDPVDERVAERDDAVDRSRASGR